MWSIIKVSHRCGSNSMDASDRTACHRRGLETAGELAAIVGVEAIMALGAEAAQPA
jgi:hypothetical protein